ncbi:MAG: CHRD domain-containing protein [Acidimicrobiales bacterium]
MRKTAVALITLLALAVATSTSAEARFLERTFVAPATGSQELPEVDTDARGIGVFHASLDRERLYFRVVAVRIDDVNMAHLHLGERDENGPVVAWLHPDAPPPETIEGRHDGVLAHGVITDDDIVPGLGVDSVQELVQEIRSGNIYLNIHTLDNPAGEIRGQLR